MPLKHFLSNFMAECVKYDQFVLCLNLHHLRESDAGNLCAGAKVSSRKTGKLKSRTGKLEANN